MQPCDDIWEPLYIYASTWSTPSTAASSQHDAGCPALARAPVVEQLGKEVNHCYSLRVRLD